MRKIFHNIIVFFLMISIGLSPLFGIQYTQAYNPGYIITDAEMFDYESMDQAQIYQFLLRKRSYLATYQPDGQTYASYFIYDAAQKYRVNPKVILTMLQKEQSLVENTYTPSQYRLDWAMGYGMCDSCNRNTPGIEKFIGFENQVYMAAKRLREYYENPDQFNFVSGNMYSISGEDVMILNQSTAGLYNYTPHLHGNKNFWRIWQRWFVKNIPNGSLVKLDNQPTVWLIRYGQKRPISSVGVLRSRYDESKIIQVTPTDLDKYEDGAPIAFYEYSLLKDLENKIYLVTDEDIIRPLASQEVFRFLGYNHEELIEISSDDLENFVIGDEITLGTAYPMGAILENRESQELYYVLNGTRQKILDERLISLRFKYIPRLKVDSEEIELYQLTAPLKIPDGTLVKSQSNPAVYIIDEGQRRSIPSEKIFLDSGYSWSQIATISDDLLNLHPLGNSIDTGK